MDEENDFVLLIQLLQSWIDVNFRLVHCALGTAGPVSFRRISRMAFARKSRLLVLASGAAFSINYSVK